ncbi:MULTISPECIES: LysR substrate-binding domain-containing protein [unclassified Rhizobium]|uniref:LysR substrate-binding domain-containing protein n=1 Tax=unclassified Rhizobium TaxID=2613769 RepID=UPI001ADA8A5E|nr:MULTISPECIES: LysR substrate-binding domain-containing protein [unclassified Rhizobium]MBO9096850.1 LysR family transcriptional regulator [Rhizobium sp. L58/93]QXZ87357.1 LysR family transcriptional regulator [Rhizobium sp. K1/93]QXZ92611.1 LysR family transcriptional regulator [Rhizobium sp. K15/93]QYA04167.1 LysR family transcriptional regulator [Rhizobium sp. B21/90]
MKLSKQFPLNALRVFDAVARMNSFTKAGVELGMTQTAVSYQIKLLEENVGELLFVRQPRAISLTEAGERLAPKVSEAFELLQQAMVSVRQAAAETLTIHSTATFGQQWLSRHIGAFQLLHPHIAVRLVTTSILADFNRDSADVAIRWGTGDWPGLTCHKIMAMEFTPMLSRDAAARVGGIHAPIDLLKLPIISAGDVWWKQWFEAAGVHDPGLERYPKNEFGTQVLEAGLAMTGEGVAMLNPAHFEDDVAAGRLYQPFALTCIDARDYWLAYPEGRRNISKIKVFRRWLLEKFDVAAA